MPEHTKGITLGASPQGYLHHQIQFNFKHPRFLILKDSIVF